MSGEWAIVPAKATSFPFKKIGMAIVISGRWPEASQGSLVMITSPSCHWSCGYSRKKCFIVRGTVAMKEGMLAVLFTRPSPLAVVSMQA